MDKTAESLTQHYFKLSEPSSLKQKNITLL